MPREENYEANMVSKLAASKIVEMPKDVLDETKEALYTERIQVGTIEEKED